MNARIANLLTDGDQASEQGRKSRQHLTRQLGVVAARIPPTLIVVDLDLNVVSWSPSSGVADMISAHDHDLREAVRNSWTSREQLVHILDGDILLRIVPMESDATACVVIMIESFGQRGSLDRTASLYQLTKREVEILALVVQGLSNAEIAETLYVAHSTVADHLKNVMRKTRTTKRIHLLSKISYGAPDKPNEA